MLLSIVIPAFNEGEKLERTVECLEYALTSTNLVRDSWEIIVCDNNSTDRTAAIASSLGATVVYEPVNQISRARNTGATIAKGKWLLFLDADSFPSPQLMTDVLEVIGNRNIVGCGATVSVEDGTTFNRLRMERLNPLFRALRLSGGAFLLCRRDAFLRIGGFSTGLYALEDIEFVLRLKRYGRSIGNAFIVLHKHPVITSGRKGEYRLSSMLALVSSNIIALVLFALHFVLPRRWVGALGARLLQYWYRSPR